MSTPSLQASFILIVIFALCAWTYAQQPAPVPVSTPVPVLATIQMVQPSQAVTIVQEWAAALTLIVGTLAVLYANIIGKIGEMKKATDDAHLRLDTQSKKINDIALATQPTTTPVPPENTH